jgi:hypothetical protein
MKNARSKGHEVSYQLQADGRFVITNYNQAKPFSNFFPGIAGVWGVPMWVFYTNRGQCLSSFGIESKDKAILEFQPANKAYRLTPTQGFRTFIKVKTGRGKSLFWEPFATSALASSFIVEQSLSMSSHDLIIEETNKTLGLKISVHYFTIVGEVFPGLVRHVRVSNVSRKRYALEIIDGLSILQPYGIKDWLAKNLSRTVEAWVKVKNLKNRVPFFHLNVEVSDTPDVTYLHEGNFFVCFDPAAPSDLCPAIVEAATVFGQGTDFGLPQAFLNTSNFQVPDIQQTSNRTPCAMAWMRAPLASQATKEWVSVFGYAHHEHALKAMVKKITAPGFAQQKAQANALLVTSLKQMAFTHSSSSAFDQYCGQTFLDNVMRGGLPVSLQTREGAVAFNVYSRKHGDMERDYNHFVLAATYFSQGNGNYRDVNQNRRNDIWFNQDVRQDSIVNFFNLQQADGYNPLVVKGLSFSVESPSQIDAIIQECLKTDDSQIREYLTHGFQPGELVQYVVQKEIPLKMVIPAFLGRILGMAQRKQLADHGEGFWSDHWTYNLDLIESYLALYPEQLEDLLLRKRIFIFYLNDHYVLPRDHRYRLTPKGVRQYHTVHNGQDEIQAKTKGYVLKTGHGEGKVHETTLIVKLLCLIANKTASLDPSGIGIEMEADKPNWYDALNGLPGLLGSSISETLELQRLCCFIKEALNRLDLGDREHISIFAELAQFCKGLTKVLASVEDSVQYWHQANELKENYRGKIRKGIDGQQDVLTIAEIRELLTLVIDRTNGAVKKATDAQGILRTYFYHEVTEYTQLTRRRGEEPFVLPVSFKRHDLPCFLEGFVHALRVATDEGQARQWYEIVRRSPLFDKKLKMYKVNASLLSETEEIGRTRIFPPGWLENESIWLHMEYKYLLELLRTGLYKEFYAALPDVLIPFLEPQRYGRSILENSSFLVSSAHEDAALHGQGFVARLSGSTAEFMHMWLMMNVGRKPFRWEGNKRLELALQPALPGWLFSEKEEKVVMVDHLAGEERRLVLPANTYAFKFLGDVLVVYHNPKRKDTFGLKACRITEVVLTYRGQEEPVSLPVAVIPDLYAQDVRDHKVERIDVHLR